MHSRTLNALTHKILEFTQQENADLKYRVNWAAALDEDTVATSTWTTEDSGLTIAGESTTTTVATARLSGDVGKYRVVNKVTTSGGETQERYIDLTIKDNSVRYTRDYGLVA